MYYTRESIFIATLRTFCVCFSAIIGIVIAFFVILLGFSYFSSNVEIPEKAKVIISPDAQGNRSLLSTSSPVILRMNFHGVIGQGDLKEDVIQNLLLDSREDFFKDNRVKGILLHMNTPGGLATDADIIYRALLAYKEKYKVPVYAYVEDLCASGGVYISSAADKIYCSPTGVYGSVGVVMGPAFNFSKVMEAVGIQALTLTQGKDKDMLNPFRPWQPGEDQSLVNVIADLYQQFVSIVLASRPQLDKEKLINEYGAQVYMGQRAKDMGFIDVACSSYNQALADLAVAAGIGQDKSYQVIVLQPEHTFLSELAQSSCALLKGKITHVIQVGQEQDPELSGKFLYLYQPSNPSLRN